MRDLLVARMAEEKKILASRLAYREKFFAPDCLWDSRQFTLEMIESEQILSVENSGPLVTVITQYTASVSAVSARVNRRRYQLKPQGDGFVVCQVELQCPYCHGEGDQHCLACGGKHWLG